MNVKVSVSPPATAEAMAGPLVGYVDVHDGDAAPDGVQARTAGLDVTLALGPPAPVAAPHPQRRTTASVRMVRRIACFLPFCDVGSRLYLVRCCGPPFGCKTGRSGYVLIPWVVSP